MIPCYPSGGGPYFFLVKNLMPLPDYDSGWIYLKIGVIK